MRYNVKDKYFKRAKDEGYRARSAYKLMEIMQKFPNFWRSYENVLDIGAAPGSFMQVISETKTPDALLVGVDRTPIDPIPAANVQLLQANILQENELYRVLSEADIPENGFDTIISDLAPNISGVFMVDQMRSIELNQQVIDIAKHFLKRNGNLLLKQFVWEDFPEFLKEVKKQFKRVHMYTPESTRQSSREQYMVCFGYMWLKGKS